MKIKEILPIIAAITTLAILSAFLINAAIERRAAVAFMTKSRYNCLTLAMALKAVVWPADIGARQIMEYVIS